MDNFGDRLAFCRTLAGLSQNAAAKRMGLGQSSLSSYEAGVREPGMSAILAMAHAYGVSTDFLLGLTDEAELSDGRHLSLSGTVKASPHAEE